MSNAVGTRIRLSSRPYDLVSKHRAKRIDDSRRIAAWAMLVGAVILLVNAGVLWLTSLP